MEFIYTDGACSNNGNSKAIAGIGIFFGIDDIRNVSRRIIGKQTNNIAELNAILQAYPLLEKDKFYTIVSDSEYAIRCVTTYGEKCFKKNWKVDIPNKELVRETYELYKSTNVNVQVLFLHVRSHTGKQDIHSIGNAHADKLAVLSITAT